MGAKRDRQVAAFDEGELWCTDEADPPSNPAGWYFRAPRGTPQLWIGPFADEDEAAVAPFSGDALRDARRYLDLWRRGEPAPRPKPVVAVPAPGPVPAGAPQLELALAGEAAPSPPRPPGSRRARRREASRQLALSFELR